MNPRLPTRPALWSHPRGGTAIDTHDPSDLERLKGLHLEDFREREGRVFACDEAGPGFRLVEVADLATGGDPTGGRTPFLLRFESPASLAQRIYVLEDPKLGRLPIFLVPVGEREETVIYEAVFR